MVTSEKQNAGTLASIVSDCREAAKIRRQSNFHTISTREVAEIYERLAYSIERASALSPHPRGEPVGYVSAATMSALGQSEGSGPIVACAAFDTIIPLFTAPPPAGVDAVRGALEAARAFIAEIDVAPRHVARLLEQIDAALLPAPPPQEKPTGDKT